MTNRKIILAAVIAVSCSCVLASQPSDAEHSLPLTLQAASDFKKSGICLAAKRTLAAQSKGLHEPTKKANATLLALIEERHGKSKVTLTERIASEWASAMSGNLDLASKQLDIQRYAEVYDEISEYLKSK